MKKIFFATVAIFLTLQIKAQDKVLLGQYFQNMPAFNPALAGANDFLDLRMGVRQQWMGFEGAPGTLYVSGYGTLGNYKQQAHQRHSLRTDRPVPAATRGSLIKHGVGGNLQMDEQGPFQQMEFNLNYAVHVPVNYRTYLALGLSPGIYNAKIDFLKVSVNDPSDPTYDRLVENGESSTFFQLSGGLSLYSDRFYVGYSTMQLTRALLSGNEALNNKTQSMRHQVMGGYRFYLNQDIELVPNAFVRMEESVPLLWDAGARVQYKGTFWLGASYRNDDSLVGMLGLLLKDKFRVGYSYEHKMAGAANFNSSSHEIVLGLQLFNYSRYVSMW